MADQSTSNAESPDRSAFEGLRVADVMLSRPKTMPAGSTVGQVRRLFDNPRVMTALLADADAFRGAIGRGEIPPDASDDEPALDYTALDTPSIASDARVEDALEQLRYLNSRRLVVLDSGGASLLGLVCLNTAGTGFCKKP
jgi:CBS domain-containing protein